MTERNRTVGVDRPEAIASGLQAVLVDLLALSLNAKQAHWNVSGRYFLPVHEQLDRIVDDSRAWADLIAERAVTLGVPADGRPETVATAASAEAMPEGFVEVDKAIRLVAEQADGIVARMREGLEEVGRRDPVTQSVLIDVVQGLEKHLWMLTAQGG